MNIAVIDYGMGNIGSICNMLKYIGAPHVVSRDHREIASCDKIVLPGVGHFDLAMQNLEKFDIIEPLKDLVLDRKMPILGICLGMQLMCSASEEGNRQGLGYVDAQVCRFAPPVVTGLKVPHMGWSEVSFEKENALSDQLGERARFYFVHSYRVTCDNPDDVWGVTDYGEPFVSAFVRDNIVGVQFHPEKSHRYGIQLFRNFVSGFGA
ncbi:imidazole glycerol phosphate synthase subunit HisH [Sphingomonas hankookensis]|uniref:imidazole glycerol phosphate synthase subunit HisH n=1 Tax=Sphingomonas hankookensis TaxID=563996 RepID=UPI001F5656A8|nr:imidazole glycerol phosphate synthase subunit HisH [Sphingomonas hankookensis]